MTIHIASVGRSLIDRIAFVPTTEASDRNELIRDLQDSDFPNVLRFLAESGDTGDRIHSAFESDSLLESLDQGFLLDQSLVQRWPKSMCAELATLWFENGYQSIGDDDLVVLVVSDSAVGQLAGLWVGVALTRGLGGDPQLEQLKWIKDTGNLESIDRTKRCIAVVPVKKLDPRTDSDFEAAMSQIGGLLGRIWNMRADDEEFQFHLSGGFKATVPFLIAGAEWVRSKDDTPVSAWILAEDGRNRVRLPLRKVPADDERRCVLEYFAADGTSDRRPYAGNLEGYAYLRDGAQARLTPLGRGFIDFLRAVRDA